MCAQSLHMETGNNIYSDSCLGNGDLFPFDDAHMKDWERLGCHQSLWRLGQASLSGLPIEELYNSARQLLMDCAQIEDCAILQLQSDGHRFRSVTDGESSTERKESTLQALTTAACSDETLDISVVSKHWQEYYLDPYHSSRSTPDVAIDRSIVGVVIPGQTNPPHPLGLICVLHTEAPSLNRTILALMRAVAKVLSTAIERHRSESLLRIQAQVLQAVASGKDLKTTLIQLCKLIEAQTPGAFCSILLLDREQGTLHAGVAPSLPSAYADALEGLVIGERAGSCGTAAYTGKATFVEDISSDPLWEQFRDLALIHNINACWSIPFVSKAGKILGTFAISHPHPCRPTPFHIKILEMASNLASISVEGHLANEQLCYMANHDCVTGLVNRSHFMQHLQNAIDSQCDRNKNQEGTWDKTFSVLFLDLDRFKLVNDSLGHAAGDKFLRTVGQRIQNCLRDGDILARLGGDEFGIIVGNTKTIERAIDIAERIISSLHGPLELGHRKFHTSVSMGIVHVSDRYNNSETVLRDADTAMYHAKRQKNAGYAVFDAKIHHLAQHQLTLELEFRRAIEALGENKQDVPFYLVYQPIVELSSGRIEGFEALIRWEHAELGLIPPVEFIPLAESTDLIVPLGDWILDRVCQQLSVWRQKYPSCENLKVNVNISGKQFLMTDVLTKISSTLERLNLDASALRIEITESILIEVESLVAGQFDRFKQLNIPLCLDDFGTGYSSLSYLQAFPVTILKLDRSFIRDLDRDSSPIVQAVIDLAHKLGMKVVAEGIETPNQWQALLHAGCDWGQGYLFSPPVSAEAAQALIESAGSECGIV